MAKNQTDKQKIEIELSSIKFRMQDYLESENDDLKQPGQFLKEYLKTLGIAQKKFANYIGVNASNLSKMIKGERQISYELATILGKIFNNNPMLWVEIQAKNELKKIRRSKREKIKNYSLKDLIK